MSLPQLLRRPLGTTQTPARPWTPAETVYLRELWNDPMMVRTRLKLASEVLDRTPASIIGKASMMFPPFSRQGSRLLRHPAKHPMIVRAVITLHKSGMQLQDIAAVLRIRDWTVVKILEMAS